MRPYFEASESERRKVRDTIARILDARPEVILAFLFGSFVDQPHFRDVDVGVVVDTGLVPETAALDLAAELATELEWETRLPVDLNVLNYAPVALRYSASRGKVLLCKDAGLRDRFVELAWKEYLDFEPFLRASLRDLLEGEEGEGRHPGRGTRRKQ